MTSLVMQSPSAHMLNKEVETQPRSNSLKMSKGHVLGCYEIQDEYQECGYSEEY